MTNQRIDLVRNANSSYSQLQYLQWLTILLGLVTTVVVSVSSAQTFGDSKGLRFTAILLPALGTAVAALSAFYNPRDDWNKSANTLANLAQLHGQISSGIWLMDCPIDVNKGKVLAQKLDEWTKRYTDVVAIAETTPSGAKPDDKSKGQLGGRGP